MMVLTVLAFILTQTQPVIHAAHFIPGDVPSLIITGRDLWVGSEADAISGKKNTVTVNGVAGEWDSLTGASNNDANRGLSCVQRVWFPGGLEPSSSAKLEFERHDGAKATRQVFIPINRGRRTGFTSGRRTVVDVPFVVRDGQTLDLEGSEVVVSGAFSGSELIRYGRGSTIRNGRLLIAEDCRAPITAVLRSAYIGQRGAMPSTFGLHIDGLEILDLRRRGVGIDTGSCRASFFGHSRIIAWSSIQRFPQDESAENIFYDLEFTSPIGRVDGGVGNVLCGHRNLIWRCHWHNIDRGPTGGCWGSPQSQTTWFECVQHATGHTQGASEGLLYECAESLDAQATFSGTTATINAPLMNARRWSQLRAGYFIARPDGRYAVIRSLQRAPNAPTATITMDAPVSRSDATDSAGEVRIGNGIVENNFIRCRFSDGKSGIFLFGLALNNYIGGCRFSDLRGGIVQLQARDEWGWSFGSRTFERVNVFHNVVEPRVTIANTRDWPPRQ